MSISGTTADALREAASIVQLNPHLIADYITYNARPDRGTIGIQVSTVAGRSDDEQIAAVDAWAFALAGQPRRVPTPNNDGTVADFYEFTSTIDRFTWYVYAPLRSHVCEEVSA